MVGSPRYAPSASHPLLAGRAGRMTLGSRPAAAGARRRPRRPSSPVPSTSDLVEVLHKQPGASLDALRRRRFTLRIVWAAVHEGLVDVDLEQGRVALPVEAGSLLL